jgi:putative tryptophan/tyrosine transport system substrate-binding protein
MRRREFISVVGGAAATWPLAAAAQKRTALIGLLGSDSAQSSGIFVDSLKEGLSDSGLRDNKKSAKAKRHTSTGVQFGF